MSFLKHILRWGRLVLFRAYAAMRPQASEWGKVLILAPHPDDETLGCGGLIYRLCHQGNPPHVVILTGGGQSHAGCCHIEEETLKQARRHMATHILTRLGLPETHIHLLDFPDGAISAHAPEMAMLATCVQNLHPDQILIPHHGEGWPDHLVVRNMLANFPLPAGAQVIQYCVWVWYYQVWKMGWCHAHLLSLSPEEHRAKQQAVDEYVTTVAPCGKPWSGVLPPLLINACTWNKELFFDLP